MKKARGVTEESGRGLGAGAMSNETSMTGGQPGHFRLPARAKVEQGWCLRSTKKGRVVRWGHPGCPSPAPRHSTGDLREALREQHLPHPVGPERGAARKRRSQSLDSQPALLPRPCPPGHKCSGTGTLPTLGLQGNRSAQGSLCHCTQTLPSVCVWAP